MQDGREPGTGTHAAERSALALKGSSLPDGPAGGRAYPGGTPADGETPRNSTPADGETPRNSTPADGETPRNSTPADGETPRNSTPADGGLRDEVDDLVAAWRAQRPDLDVEPLQVLSRVSRLARHLDLARRASFASHELEAWEFDVLSALRRQGPPYQMTPGALIRATLVTSGTMTNRIDRLAEAGLVHRRPDPRDRRGVLVTLTDQGRAKADDALADLLRRERKLLASLGADDRHTLAGLLRTLLAPFDALPPE